MTKPDIEALLSSDDKNFSVIEIDNYLGELCNYGSNYERLTQPQAVFYLNQQFEREINNGGFDLFFTNSTGDHAHETIQSLKEIEAYYTAELLQSAIDQFPNSNVPKDVIERRKLILESWADGNERWNELDSLFYKYKDNLNELNLEYVSKNQDKF